MKFKGLAPTSVKALFVDSRKRWLYGICLSLPSLVLPDPCPFSMVPAPPEMKVFG